MQIRTLCMHFFKFENANLWNPSVVYYYVFYLWIYWPYLMMLILFLFLVKLILFQIEIFMDQFPILSFFFQRRAKRPKKICSLIRVDPYGEGPPNPIYIYIYFLSLVVLWVANLHQRAACLSLVASKSLKPFSMHANYRLATIKGPKREFHLTYFPGF